MMKLYYSPGACSLSPHIVLRELGLLFNLEKVDTKTHQTADGTDFYQINPKGYVPVLKLDDGALLTEGVAIVQYLADTHAAKGLAPQAGTLERARLQEHLNYIASELHKGFGPLFHPGGAPESKEAAKAEIAHRLDHIEQVLSDGRNYLLGDSFSVADVYLFVVAGWTKAVGMGTDKWPRLTAFLERVGQRPAVQEALRAEGLSKS